MLFPNDDFSPNQDPPEGPENGGKRGFLHIAASESGALLVLNLLFLLTCVPLVTIPPAIFALNGVVRGLLDDKPARVSAYWAALRDLKGTWRQGWGAFLLSGLPLLAAGYGMAFYLRLMGANWVFCLPFLLCSTVFLAALLGGTYLWGLLACGRALNRETVRLALALGLGKPLRGALAAAVWYLPAIAAVLFLPLSGSYLLLLGFSVPCLGGHFLLGEVLGPYRV